MDRAQLAAAAAVVEEVRQQALVARLHQALLLALVSVLRPRPQRRQPHQPRQRQPFRLFQQMPKATTRYQVGMAVARGCTDGFFVFCFFSFFLGRCSKSH